MKLFEVDILTKREKRSFKVTSMKVTCLDGQLGILANHEPFKGLIKDKVILNLSNEQKEVIEVNRALLRFNKKATILLD